MTHMADGHAVYELSIDSVGHASRRLISDSEEAMDAIIRDATEEWVRANPARRPLPRRRRARLFVERQIAKVMQALHNRLFRSGWYCDSCC